MSWEMKILYCHAREGNLLERPKEVLGWVWGEMTIIALIEASGGGGKCWESGRREKAGLLGAARDLWGSTAGHQEHLR